MLLSYMYVLLGSRCVYEMDLDFTIKGAYWKGITAVNLAKPLSFLSVFPYAIMHIQATSAAPCMIQFQ